MRQDSVVQIGGEHLAFSKIKHLVQVTVIVVLVVAACATAVTFDRKQGKTPTTDDADANAAAGALAIMQGVTTGEQTQIVVLAEKSQEYSYSLRETGQDTTAAPTNKRISNALSQRWALHRLLFKGLKPATEYYLQVRSTLTNDLLDTRRLRTLDPARRDLKFAFTSCMLDTYRQDDIWEQMVKLNPDVIFLIGDNVYTDSVIDDPTPADLWRRNFETRDRIKLFRNKTLVPIVAVWDDHDYGKNNAGEDFPHKEESLKVFKEFFASDRTDNYYMPGLRCCEFLQHLWLSVFSDGQSHLSHEVWQITRSALRRSTDGLVAE